MAKNKNKDEKEGDPRGELEAMREGMNNY